MVAVKRWARLRIRADRHDDLGRIFDVESDLRMKGVDFDTGYDLLAHVRDWELDWSLRGPMTPEAVVKFAKDRGLTFYDVQWRPADDASHREGFPGR